MACTALKKLLASISYFSPARLLWRAAVFALLTLVGYSAAFIAIILRLREESTQNELIQTVPGHAPTSAWERFASIHQYASDLALARYPEHLWQDPEPWTASWFLLFSGFSLALIGVLVYSLQSAHAANQELPRYTRSRLAACVRLSWIEATACSRWLVLAQVVLGFSLGLIGEAVATLRTHFSSLAAWKTGNPAAAKAPTAVLGLFDMPELLMLPLGIILVIGFARSRRRIATSAYCDRLARRLCSTCSYPTKSLISTNHLCPECGGTGVSKVARSFDTARWVLLFTLLGAAIAAYAITPIALHSK